MDPELVFQGDKVKTRDIHKDHFPVGGQGYISEVQSGQEYRTESCCPNLHKAKNMVRVKDRGQRWENQTGQGDRAEYDNDTPAWIQGLNQTKKNKPKNQEK